MGTVKKEFAESLSSIRKSYGVSQSIMASSVPVPTETYIQWESGRRTPPGYVQTLVLQAITRRFHYEQLPTEDAAEESAKVKAAATHIMTSCDVNHHMGKYISDVEHNLMYGRYVTCIKNVPSEFLQNSTVSSVKAGDHFYVEPYNGEDEHCAPLRAYISNSVLSPSILVLKKVRKNLNLALPECLRTQYASKEILRFSNDNSEFYDYFCFGYLERNEVKQREGLVRLHSSWYVPGSAEGKRLFYAYVDDERIEATSVYEIIDKLQKKNVKRILLSKRLNNDSYEWIDIETLEYHDR